MLRSTIRIIATADMTVKVFVRVDLPAKGFFIIFSFFPFYEAYYLFFLLIVTTAPKIAIATGIANINAVYTLAVPIVRFSRTPVFM